MEYCKKETSEGFEGKRLEIYGMLRSQFDQDRTSSYINFLEREIDCLQGSLASHKAEKHAADNVEVLKIRVSELETKLKEKEEEIAKYEFENNLLREIR